MDGTTSRLRANSAWGYALRIPPFLLSKTITPEVFKPQGLLLRLAQIHSSQCAGFVFARHGDPYGNRTHVTAVKGRCLNRLTNGPGSGDLIRTGDIPGMNRLLYQLSYAAMWSMDSGTAEISFVIISATYCFVNRNICIFPYFLEMIYTGRM